MTEKVYLLRWGEILYFNIPLEDVVINCISIDSSFCGRFHDRNQIIDQDPRSSISAENLKLCQNVRTPYMYVFTLDEYRFLNF